MWKLTIEDDEGKQTSLPLAHDEYGVGRAEANAIRLTDRNVSRRHATLKKNGRGWFVADLSSYNGTYVNGTRVVGEQLISNGDVVQLGDYRLELIDEALQTTQAASVDPNLAANQPPVHHRPDRLVVVVGPTPGAEFPLDREYFTIGRAEDASISINHTSVSRLHAELIALGGGRYEIVDKQSANGIRINGVELRRGILEAGDALELGDVRLRFVGAGKIYRPGVDQSQQLRAVGSLESMAPSVRAPASPPSPNRGIGKFVGIGVLAGILAVVAAAFALKKLPPNADRPIAPAPAAEDAPARALKDAQTMADAGDVDGAHKKLLEIPESSPLRDDPAFRAIEGKWADALFQRAATLGDADKMKVYHQIASTPTVPAERRKRAAEMHQELAAAAAADAGVAIPPQPATFPGPGGQQPAPSAGQVSAGGGAVGTPAGPSGSASARPPDAKAAEPAGVGPEAVDNESIRKQLGPRLWSGKATETEIRMLKAACSALGDRACRDRAAAELAKKKQGG